MSTDNNPWVYYADRRPTKSDGDAAGLVLSRYAFGHIIVRLWNDSTYAEGQCWMRIHDLPLVPKRKVWREPTQADLDAATEPIPCRCWNGDDSLTACYALVSISKFGSLRFITTMSRFHHCEIEVDE